MKNDGGLGRVTRPDPSLPRFFFPPLLLRRLLLLLILLTERLGQGSFELSKPS